MAKVSMSEGHICVIKVDEVCTPKDGLEQMKKALVKFTTSDQVHKSELDTYILLDFSLFNIINSSMISILGSLAADKKVMLLGLCGLQPSVLDILKRFGLVSDANRPHPTDNGQQLGIYAKIRLFPSVKDGLVALSPH